MSAINTTPSLSNIQNNQYLETYVDSGGYPRVVLKSPNPVTGADLYLQGNTANTKFGFIRFQSQDLQKTNGQIYSGNRVGSSTDKFPIIIETFYNDDFTPNQGLALTAFSGQKYFVFRWPGEIVDGNGDVMLTKTSLGNKIVSSSLTSLGTLNSLSVSSSGTGDIPVLSSSNATITALSATTINATGVSAQTVSATNYEGLPPPNVTPITLDTTNKRVAIDLTTPPQYTLDVNGDINIPAGASFRINGTPLSTDLTPITLDPTNHKVTINNTLEMTTNGAIQGNALSISSTNGGTWNITDTSSNNMFTVNCVSDNKFVAIGNATTQQPDDILIVGGDSTFDGDAIVTGNLAVDTNLLIVDAANDKVGINKAPSLATLDVSGTINSTGNISTDANFSCKGIGFVQRVGFHGDNSYATPYSSQFLGGIVFGTVTVPAPARLTKNTLLNVGSITIPAGVYTSMFSIRFYCASAKAVKKVIACISDSPTAMTVPSGWDQGSVMNSLQFASDIIDTSSTNTSGRLICSTTFWNQTQKTFYYNLLFDSVQDVTDFDVVYNKYNAVRIA